MSKVKTTQEQNLHLSEVISYFLIVELYTKVTGVDLGILSKVAVWETKNKNGGLGSFPP